MRVGATFGRLVAGAIIYCLSLSASLALLGAWLPMPEMTNLTSKYRYFAAHRDKFDALFLGSSEFFHGIIPQHFDQAVTAATGQPMRSFNFGASGMWPPESFHFLRKILALRPPHLRWVFIDLMDIDMRPRKAAGITRRLVYWHDRKHTDLVLQRIAEQPGSPEEEREQQWDHRMLEARRLLNIGCAAEWLVEKMRKRNFGRGKEWAKNLGYDEGSTEAVSGSKLAYYETQLERFKNAGPPPPMGPALSRAVQELSAEIRAAGAEPIFISCPSLASIHYFAPPPSGPELWRFNDPERYPELFEAGVHCDIHHLTPPGAQRFTRRLAERFAEYVRAH